MGKRRVHCIVCEGALVAQTMNISEGEDGEGDVEELSGFTCNDCGLHYDNLPKARIVDLKKWEAKIVQELGGSD